MIRIRDLSLPPDGDMARLVQAAARQLRISPNEIKQLDLKKKSVDARKKNDVRIIYTVDVAVKGREDKILKMAHSPKASIARDTLYSVPQPQALPDSQPIIVGFGPAGMFAALVLSMAGLRPLVLERGQDAKTRHEAVSRFWQTGELDPECNVQFGEGGAGTFSDGKLNTGVKNERIGWILEQFAEAGASADILYDAKPHIGTDELVTVVQNLREKILHYGGEIRFDGINRLLSYPEYYDLDRLKEMLALFEKKDDLVKILSEAAENIMTEQDIASFVEAGADIILLPAPGTVPGITQEYAQRLITCAHQHGALTITSIGTSQEGADTDTIRRIALMCKMAGTDIHHIGDTGVPGMALPQNIMAYSIAIRGERHTYHKMAQSVNR